MPHFYTIQDVLTFAIRLEQAAQEFYRRLSSQSDSPSVARFLAELVREEKHHEQQLEKLLSESGGIPNQRISADQIDAYIQAIRIPASLDYKEAVKLAMDKENAARMLYAVIAKVTEEPILRDVFMQLCEQEKKHQEYFEKEYRRICISEN
ncbi:MAG: ferritin family protein [Planctomycetota bacterium]